jgi:hypothetical protein
MNYRIKKTIACKEVGNYMIDASIIHTHTPQFGEVAVFEVLEIGKHYTVQGQSKRLVQIVEGDYILAAFANRYATEQFEGYVQSFSIYWEQVGRWGSSNQRMHS